MSQTFTQINTLIKLDIVYKYANSIKYDETLDKPELV